MMKISKHASMRQQQRGIPNIVIDLLMDFGTVERAGTEASTYYFDKKSRRQVKAYAGQLSGQLEAYLDYYAIVSDEGKLITVAPRIKKVKH